MWLSKYAKENKLLLSLSPPLCSNSSLGPSWKEPRDPSLGWDAVNIVWFIDSLNEYLFSTQFMPGIMQGVGIWGEALKHGHCPSKGCHMLGMHIKQGVIIRQCCGYSGRSESVLQKPKSEDRRGVVWEVFLEKLTCELRPEDGDKWAVGGCYRPLEQHVQRLRGER